MPVNVGRRAVRPPFGTPRSSVASAEDNGTTEKQSHREEKKKKEGLRLHKFQLLSFSRSSPCLCVSVVQIPPNPKHGHNRAQRDLKKTSYVAARLGSGILSSRPSHCPDSRTALLEHDRSATYRATPVGPLPSSRDLRRTARRLLPVFDLGCVFSCGTPVRTRPR